MYFGTKHEVLYIVNIKGICLTCATTVVDIILYKIKHKVSCHINANNKVK